MPSGLSRLAIDASGITTGGGVVHLRELLNASAFVASRFEEIFCWGSPELIAKLPPLQHVRHISVPELSRGIVSRAIWQRSVLPREMRRSRCDALFVAGSSSFASGGDFVTINHNLLPFEFRELLREGPTRQTLRLLSLRLLQGWTMRRSKGTIFLTDYAQDVVSRVAAPLRCRAHIVPHGVNEEFRRAPRPVRAIEDCSESDPFRLLYVSPVAMYKHQWNVVKAVGALRQEGMPLQLELVGARSARAAGRLDRAIAELPHEHRRAIVSRPVVPHAELPEMFGRADLFVFASSCETFGITLVEAMASGLPIACSSRGPMPAILGATGFFFDPESAESIKNAIRSAVRSPESRSVAAADAYERALAYSWKRCARETFQFIRRVYGRGAEPSAVTRS